MISFTHRTRWRRHIWRNYACMTRPRGENEPDSIFPAAPPRDSAGDSGAHLARGIDDDFCDRHWCASWDPGNAETLAFQANPGQREYCGDDSKSRAIRI